MKRRPPRDAWSRLYLAVMSIRAINLARQLAAGIALAPGERNALSNMPSAVQSAVNDCWKPDSRYMARSRHKLRQVVAKARAEGRIKVEPREWNQALHVALEGDDALTVFKARRAGKSLPANVTGALRIRQAIAAWADTTVETLRVWEREAKNIHGPDGEPLLGEDAEKRPAAIREF